MSIQENGDRGFTLIEVLISLALFTVVIVMSVSALLTVVDGNRKAQSMKAIMNNLNFALDSISREMRVGTNFTSSFSITSRCAHDVSFANFDGHAVRYAMEQHAGDSGNRIYRTVDGVQAPLTAGNIILDNGDTSPMFCLYGNSSLDTTQPYTFIRLIGHAGVSEKTTTNFSLQTVVSQRLPDIP
ncbi:hypothetical protein A2671_02215 [Candidatus Kaiserbacteria bacterium RIFCSPHIGHO2_01_FULL_49_13]|uniref:Prepilin-type N-terminal cleavage/methylation domain-containing protein n=1 Tax=Candidatus Kaiserbacteria bacterium RIFCSPHIGHO2_01_FULL_49_13 TaxID=1798477 RepID=A0A1F6CDG8_9BACT|nr:MAG: hypothetical protein A2671_02215 [Candidatus Kaiserbacteria bacterium RIFCSPHIGHO2_01_FULL_49_13]